MGAVQVANCAQMDQLLPETHAMDVNLELALLMYEPQDLALDKGW
jgi:hypothetical protein